MQLAVSAWSSPPCAAMQLRSATIHRPEAVDDEETRPNRPVDLRPSRSRFRARRLDRCSGRVVTGKAQVLHAGAHKQGSFSDSL